MHRPRDPRRAPRLLAVVLVSACTASREPSPVATADVGHGRVGVTVTAPVTRYRIESATLAGIRAEIRREGPKLDGRRWDGATTWQISWAYGTVAGGVSGCEVRDARVRVTAAISMPEWMPDAEADEATKVWWRRYEGALMKHEEGHARIAVAAANALHARLGRMRASTCSLLHQDVSDIGRQHMTDLKSKQARYDAETRHGATQINAALASDIP